MLWPPPSIDPPEALRGFALIADTRLMRVGGRLGRSTWRRLPPCHLSELRARAVSRHTQIYAWRGAPKPTDSYHFTRKFNCALRRAVMTDPSWFTATEAAPWMKSSARISWSCLFVETYSFGIPSDNTVCTRQRAARKSRAPRWVTERNESRSTGEWVIRSDLQNAVCSHHPMQSLVDRYSRCTVYRTRGTKGYRVTDSSTAVYVIGIVNVPRRYVYHHCRNWLVLRISCRRLLLSGRMFTQHSCLHPLCPLQPRRGE